MTSLIKKINSTVFIYIFFITFANGQVLDLESTTEGVLIPRMTTLEREAIPTPDQSLLVYDIDEESFWYFDGIQWNRISTGEHAWIKDGPIVHHDGKVGIGLTNPALSFQIERSELGKGLMSIQNSNASGYTSIGFNDYQGNEVIGLGYGNPSVLFGPLKDKAYIDVKNEVPLIFMMESTEKMRLDNAGNLGIGTQNPEAILDVSSTQSGILLPRMTTSEKNAIAAPLQSMLVYDTDLKSFSYYENGAWNDLSGSSGISPWTETNGGIEYIGTDTLARVLIAPNGNGDVDDSELILAESNSGEWGMSLKYDGFSNLLNIYGITNTEYQGPHMTMKRNDGITNWNGLANFNKRAKIDFGSGSGGNIMPSLIVKKGNCGAPCGQAELSQAINIQNSNGVTNNAIGIGFSDDEQDDFPSAWIGTKHTNKSDHYANLEFWTRGTDGINKRMIIQDDGRVGINTTDLATDFALSVGGGIISEEVRVDLSADWPDYVFKPDYYLRPLSEVKSFISENGHLPEIPPASEMEESGIDLGKINILLMEKVEELTLYILEQEERLTRLELLLEK